MIYKYLPIDQIIYNTVNTLGDWDQSVFNQMSNKKDVCLFCSGQDELLPSALGRLLAN